MLTLCIHYTFNPDKHTEIKTYFELEQRVIERSGGRVIGYFLPTDFAGPNNKGLGLIDLPSMTAYEEYREHLADDPEHKTNVARLHQSGAAVAMERSFIQRAERRG